MINFIKLIDFMSSAHCWCHLYQSIGGFPQINYELKSGMTYGFISDFGLIDFLKKKGKIVIVSSSQKRVLRKYCDRTILFNQKRPCVHYR